MKTIDLLHIVEKAAQKYRPKAIASIKRNKHLHDCDNVGEQDFVDAILSDFINFLAAQYGVDYGIHASDIYWPEALGEWKKIEELRATDLAEAERKSDEWDDIKMLKRKGME